MPAFTSEYFAQVELAKNLKAVMQNAPNAIGRTTQPATMTATLNFDTGEVSYDFTEKKNSTTSGSTSST